MDEKYMTIKKIFFEVLNKDSKLTLEDLKDILELEFIKSNLEKIKICEIYNIYDVKLEKNNKKENFDKCVKKEDKEKIKDIILNFMNYNVKYKFREIEEHVKITFKKYDIKTISLIGLLKYMKNRKIIHYISGKWVYN